MLRWVEALYISLMFVDKEASFNLCLTCNLIIYRAAIYAIRKEMTMNPTRREFATMLTAATVATATPASSRQIAQALGVYIPPLSMPDDWTTTLRHDRHNNVLDYRWEHPITWYNRLEVQVEVQLPVGLDPVDVLNEMDGESNWHGIYIRMAEEDKYRKKIIRPLVTAITEKAWSMQEDPAKLMLSFVQGIPYASRKLYQQWPTQTVLGMAGDCSDTTVLLAAMFEQYQAQNLEVIGKRPLWLIAASWTHTIPAIRSHDRPLPDGSSIRNGYKGTGWRKGGVIYFYAESTGTGFEIGEKTPGLKIRKSHFPHWWA